MIPRPDSDEMYDDSDTCTHLDKVGILRPHTLGHRVQSFRPSSRLLRAQNTRDDSSNSLPDDLILVLKTCQNGGFDICNSPSICLFRGRTRSLIQRVFEQ